jgi:hypothetical protein
MKIVKFKILSTVLVLSLGWACVERRFIAPQEIGLGNSPKIIVVTLNDGTRMTIKDPILRDDKISGETSGAKNRQIAVTDVESVQIVRHNWTAPILLIGSAVVAVWLIGGESHAPERPPSVSSCPLVYSYDGERYVLDAEPFGGAIAKGLKRTEWLSLDHLKEFAGQYRIVTTNDLDETEFTDEMKLVVIDHPRGSVVVPDAQGRVHTFSHPTSPARAWDRAGRDIRSFVSASDGIFWPGFVDKGRPTGDAEIRDSLTFEFPKPAGARTAKLVAGAWTTMMGSRAAKGFLELYGAAIGEFYDDVDGMGPGYRRVMSWYINEELYLLKVWVETKEGWKRRALIYGGGPIIAKEKACLLDISDVSGDVLRIRLNPPSGFWKLDRIAVSYAENVPVNIIEIAPVSAMDSRGDDVLGLIAANDNAFYEMPEKGDKAELVFIAPPETPGLARTVLLKAAGYYRIHLEAKGEPQRDILDRCYSEPGFAVRYALERAGIKAKKESRKTSRTE